MIRFAVGFRGVWIGLALLLVLSLGMLGCAREVIKEVEREVQVVATPTPGGPAEQAGETGQADSAPSGSGAATTSPAASTQSGGATGGPAAAPPSDPVYKLGIFSDLTTTNYWSYLGSSGDGTIWNGYVLGGGQASLFTYSDQRFDWVPSLAADFPTPLQEETVDGETMWTSEVTLKEGMTWTDGNPVTAEDFVFTVQTVMDLELSANWAGIVDTEFVEKVEAQEPYKVKVYFKKKPGLSIWQFGLAFCPILSQAYWEPVVTEAKGQGEILEQQKFLFAHVPENEPSAGGFVFEKWEKAAFAEKTKNEDYYFSGVTVTEYANGAYAESKPGAFEFSAYGEPTGDKVLEYTSGPHADATIHSIYGNQETAVLALNKGDIDFIMNPLGLQKGLQAQLEQEENVAIVENASNGFRYLGFNVRKAPMDDIAFRKAVATLIDKEFITGTVLQGVAIPMYTTVAEGNGFWYNPDVEFTGKGLSRPERVAEAVKILKDAGYTFEKEPVVSEDGAFMEQEGEGLRMPNGELMEELTLMAPSAGYDPLRSTFAIWIERWLNDVGIPVKAQLTGFNVIVERLSDEENLELWMLGWGLSLYPDYLEVFFHSRHTGEDGLNRGGYSNPEFDALADALLEETDLEEARRLVFQMQEFLADDLPYVVLFTTPLIEAYRADRLEFPYTTVLDGIQDQGGLTTTVVLK